MKRQEFWIGWNEPSHHGMGESSWISKTPNKNGIHVIEASYADHLEAQVQMLKKALEDMVISDQALERIHLLDKRSAIFCLLKASAMAREALAKLQESQK